MSELRRYEATLVHKCGKNPYMVMASADDGDYCEYQQAADEITRLRQLLYEAEKREKEVRSKALEEAALRVDAKADSYQAEARDVRGSDSDRRFCAAVAVRLRGASADIRALQSEER